MSGYVNKLFTTISSALEFNTATLSGAIDIVVIEDDHGRRHCSPFHVRFGKLQLLKSRGIPVQIHINGQRTSLRMYLGAAGEAYFYHPASATPPVPPSPATSSGDPLTQTLPLISINSSAQPIPNFKPPTTPSPVAETTETDYPFGYISDSEVELTRNEREGTAEVVDEPRSPPLFPSQRKWSSTVAQNPLANIALNPPLSAPLPLIPEEQSTPLFSPPSSPASVSVPIPLEDPPQPTKAQPPLPSEPLLVSNSLSDVEGEEEEKLDCRSVDGYDADDDNPDQLHDLQQQVAYVLSRPKVLSFREPGDDNVESSNYDDGTVTRMNGQDGALHNNSVQSTPGMSSRDGVMDMSLCGALIQPEMEDLQIEELFERHRVSFEEFLVSPMVLYEPSLLFRIDNRLVELRVAVPFIFSMLAFNERMDIDSLARITTSKAQVAETPKSPPTPSRRFAWFGWGSSTVVGEPLLQGEDLDVLDIANAKDAEMKGAGKDVQDESENIVEGELRETDNAEDKSKENGNQTASRGDASSDVRGNGLEAEPCTPEAKREEDEPVQLEPAPIPEPEPLAISFSDLDPDALSLRPTLEELSSLPLEPGANSIRFVVESSAVELNCRIFLWSCHTKVFISDVDGTITRSDVLGHLLPAAGLDWSQVGVAGLYSQIEKNGYKVLYLTARPIGQASQTRAFLHSVTQGSAKLPNGPVLMSPNRLVESFTREVIRRKPHEFKIAALREVRCLFSPDFNPFHAGFGNRDTDVISYRAVGLIPQRIFVVNPKGELVVMKAKYESTASYSTLQDLVESVFPDISGHGVLEKIQALNENATYNDWNYWKGSLPDIDVEELLKGK